MISAEYQKDESWYTGAAKELVFAGKTEELEQLAASMDAVTLQGSRTGISGCCVPLEGSILNLSRLKQTPVFGCDAEGYYVDVLPGITIEEIEKAIAREGLKDFRLPFEPTEKSSTAGGVFALNAQGPAPLARYHVSDHLLEAELYFPAFGWITVRKGEYIFDNEGTLSINGKVFKTEGVQLPDYLPVSILTPYPGMDLLELFCGSEGMIGIAGRMRIRLLHAEGRTWKILCFASKEAALSVEKYILAHYPLWNGVTLNAFDLIDNNSLSLVKKQISDYKRYDRLPPMPEEPSFALMIELFSKQDEVIDEVLPELLECFEQFGIAEEWVWAADSLQETEIIDIFRHAVPESVNAEIEYLRREQTFRCTQTGQDVNRAVIRKIALDVYSPDTPTENVLSLLQEMYPSHAVTVHLGRHVFHIDLFAETQQQAANALRVKTELIRYFLKAKAVFAAENGFGKGKYDALVPYITVEQKELIERVRNYFDPERKLNRGNLW